MPTKTKDGRDYEVTGKSFVWTTDPDEDTPPAQVTIPLRIKLKVLRGLGADTDLNPETMFVMLEQLIPGQADVLDEMDVNDFTAMFSAWQAEYNLLNGASLGEASGSPA